MLNLFRLVALLLGCCFIVSGMAKVSSAAIEFRMESAAGATPITTNIFLVWDGNGSNQISAIEVDLITPDPASITIRSDANPPNPLNFGLRGINNGALAFSNALNGGNIALQAGDNLLTTVTFDITRFGVYPIGLILSGAFRGDLLNLVDISSEVTLTPGVIGIPEPSSMALLGLLVTGGCQIRRRPR